LPANFGTPLLPRLSALLSICGLLALGACAVKQEADDALPVEQVWAPDDYKYRIGAGDELGLRFPLNPDLNAQVTVGPDGRGVFPLLSGVRLSGLTVEEANTYLAKAYGKFLRTPVVEMLIYNYASGQVYVAGEVKLPGARAIRGEMTVAQVINDVGGLLETARQGKIVLLRRRKDGHVLMRTVDLKALYTGKSDEDVRVLPGDVIFVPRSQIVEVDRIVRQYITNALPFTINYNLNPQSNTLPNP
jgi:protein involved in polysaccharide export with SLBB domain